MKKFLKNINSKIYGFYNVEYPDKYNKDFIFYYLKINYQSKLLKKDYEWTYDGSSTNQASIENSEVILKFACTPHLKTPRILFSVLTYGELR